MAPSSSTNSAVETVKLLLSRIDAMLNDYPGDWEDYLQSARSGMATLDRIHFFRRADRLVEQLWIIQIFQDYAYHDSDNGCIRDVAEWCQRSWLRILRDHPEHPEILKGLGHNWLQRAQASLAAIHDEEGSGSSSGSSASRAAIAQRLQSPLYVEARGHLQAAVDFFTRAVASAERTSAVTGDLLVSAAEAHMNLGNVSPAPASEQHFTRAVRYLRRAQAIPGYTLSVYFRQYLEEYGRYVN